MMKKTKEGLMDLFKRYQKQLLMPQITLKEQQKLASSRVLVVGAGGLGSPVLYYLAAAGVGQMHIVDNDTVEITNLNRQILHFEKDIGISKADSAKDKLTRFNSELEIKTSAVRLNEENIAGFLAGTDLAVSCVDNFKTRYLLNKACVRNHIPMIDGGVNGFYAYVLPVLPGVTPCYNCIYPEELQSSETFGVLGATAGVAGTLMAMQAIKYLTGLHEGFGFTYIDLLTFSFYAMDTKRNAACPVCGRTGAV
jgi:adenylyltransferase/sulfurtransferase